MSDNCTHYYILNPTIMKLLKFASIFILFTIISCGRGDKPLKEANPAFSKYIQSFTSGNYLSSGARFTIRLQNTINDSIKPGQKINLDLFNFSPSVDGEAFWYNNQTIEFVPSKPLKSNTIYQVKFHLGLLINVPKEFQTMEYEVKTITQSLRLGDGIITTYPDEMRFLRYENEIITADNAGGEDIEKTVSATYNGKECHLKWTHDPNGRIHRFHIDSLARQKTGQMLQININGNKMDIDDAFKTEQRIPGIDEFEVLSVNATMGENQYITIRFSDPLLKNQNIDGLVYLASGEPLSLTVTGNTIVATTSANLKGDKTLKISKGIKNALSYKLKSNQQFELVFESLKPAVRFMGEGTIMPNTKEIYFPFEAVNLSAVDIRIIQVYENNVLFFLQENNIEDYSSIARVGRLVTQKKMNLLNNKIDPGKWNSYKIDLSKIITIEPGAIYRVEIRFRQEYSLYSCDENTEITPISDAEYEQEVKDAMSKFDGNSYYWDWDYPDDYNWQDRENPCKSSYYMNDRFPAKNILVSDIGIIAKATPTGEYIVAASDINTAKPISGAKVSFFNYQRQLLKSGSTDGNGFFKMNTKEKPFFVVVEDHNQKGYLRLGNYDALSLSNFNVGGMIMQDGMKGFIYGERGVWRPGDDLFITFILEDKLNQLPDNYPVKFKLYNPSNQLIESKTIKFGVYGFYLFHTRTSDDALTGNWNLVVQAGGATFSRNIKIETIKPNRIRAKIEFNKELITRDDLSKTFRLNAKWLHGSPAANLKYDIKLKLRKTKTSFAKYSKYNFDDQSMVFEPEEKDISNGTLNDDGWKDLSFDFGQEQVPGFLTASFTTRIFEKSGDFSIMSQSITYSHFDTYIGARILTNGNRGWYDIKKQHELGIVSVDSYGKPRGGHKVTTRIYKVNWRWWWQSYDDLSQYIRHNSTYEVAVLSAITGADGTAALNFKIPYNNWRDNARYLIVTEDEDGTHRSSFTAYFSEWYGSVGGVGEEATILAVNSDKDEYLVNEEAEIIIPSSAGGQATVSIEKGSEILDIFRVETQTNETRFKVKIGDNMAPGIYVHVSLIQPHSQTVNDNPIRMYGVIPLDVINLNTKLKPVIKMPDVLEPEKEFTVEIREETGKAMTYTLAIVDEGLLDITGFRTPDPWSRFYSREALQIRTWDLYDDIIGAYGAKLEKAIAIGGGDKILDPSKTKTQRFKPVVLFSGPISIGKGEKKTHKFTMPNYIGSVRVMVVAGEEAAYGNAEKTVAVKKDLMILSTLPRVLGPEEEVGLPVTIFAMDKKVKSVKVKITTNSLLSVEGNKTMTVSFDKTGEKIAYFPLKVASGIGKAIVHIEATSNGLKAVNDIELDVRNPNLPQTLVFDTVINTGDSWKFNPKAFGIKGTNSASIEMATMIPINLNSRLNYLIHYPYGCIEQTVSSVFPQLYLEQITSLTAEQKVEIQNNITEALSRLRTFQLPNGAFSYWPGQEISNNWGTNYAGHFLLEAKAKGYHLPSGMLQSWLTYQSSVANGWSQYDYYGADLDQAYRLFLLAKAERPSTSAMNRLREYSKISHRAKTLLAGAYAIINQKIAAIKLIEDPNFEPLPTGYYYDYTYGSSVRDDAMMAMVLKLLNKNSDAFVVVKNIADHLNSDSWMSTQTTAFSLMAVADYFIGKQTDPMKLSLNIDGKKETVEANKAMVSNEINIDDLATHSVYVKNLSSKPCYVKIIVSGTPAGLSEPPVSKNMSLDIRYEDMTGKTIDPKHIKQGTDFRAIVTISNTGLLGDYRDMSLSQIFPSGWEIINDRLFDIGENNGYVPDYRDIRDDRIYTFFNLRRNRTATFSVMLNAAYVGKYYLPSVQGGAMYDNRIEAVVPGKWIFVTKE